MQGRTSKLHQNLTHHQQINSKSPHRSFLTPTKSTKRLQPHHKSPLLGHSHRTLSTLHNKLTNRSYSNDINKVKKHHSSPFTQQSQKSSLLTPITLTSFINSTSKSSPLHLIFRKMSKKATSIDGDEIALNNLSKTTKLSNPKTTSSTWLSSNTTTTKSTKKGNIEEEKPSARRSTSSSKASIGVKRKTRPASSSSSSSSDSTTSSSSSDYSSCLSSTSSATSSSSSASSSSETDDEKVSKKKKNSTKKSTSTTNKRQKTSTNTKTKSNPMTSIRDIEDYSESSVIRATKNMPQKYIDVVTQYLLIRDHRHIPESRAYNAPVDTMGCAVTGDKDADPKVFRFQTLVSLMLSAQTKDAVTFDAVVQLRTRLRGGCSPQGVLDEPELAHDCIKKVGFHNTKIKNLLKVAEICRDDYDNDIPRELKGGLLDLPGVGPKMGNLAMQAAWGETVGIGVDVHVHRIANMLHWVEDEKKNGEPTSNPEKTRLALEKILPKQYFSEINWLLVGFGQTICPSQRPNCGDCNLGKLMLCPNSHIKRDAQDALNNEIVNFYEKYLLYANNNNNTTNTTHINSQDDKEKLKSAIPTPIFAYFEQYKTLLENTPSQSSNSNNIDIPAEISSSPNTQSNVTLPSSVEILQNKTLIKQLRSFLIKYKLEFELNITPNRIKSFMTDQPPPNRDSVIADNNNNNNAKANHGSGEIH